MGERSSLTELLNAHRDKLNQHTEDIEDIKAKLDMLNRSVSQLERKMDESEEDESGGIRLVLRTWLKQLRELM